MDGWLNGCKHTPVYMDCVCRTVPQPSRQSNVNTQFRRFLFSHQHFEIERNGMEWKTKIMSHMKIKFNRKKEYSQYTFTEQEIYITSIVVE